MSCHHTGRAWARCAAEGRLTPPPAPFLPGPLSSAGRLSASRFLTFFPPLSAPGGPGPLLCPPTSTGRHPSGPLKPGHAALSTSAPAALPPAAARPREPEARARVRRLRGQRVGWASRQAARGHHVTGSRGFQSLRGWALSHRRFPLLSHSSLRRGISKNQTSPPASQCEKEEANWRPSSPETTWEDCHGRPNPGPRSTNQHPRRRASLRFQVAGPWEG